MAVIDWPISAFLGQERAAFGSSRGSEPLTRRRGTVHYRSLFISDVHLGTRGCKAALLADFLAHHNCDTLYLVGDIIDGWQLKSRWYWNDDMTQVVQEILAKVDEGTRVVYIPGNHDEFLRPYCGRKLAGIELQLETFHETADGRRFHVLHGDKFDDVITGMGWLGAVAERFYAMAMVVNDWLYALRDRFALPYWSTPVFLKRVSKKFTEVVWRFEKKMIHATGQLYVDGIIIGHLHRAENRRIGNILYLNDGDWVESCTALAEDARGNLEILHWAPSSMAGDAIHVAECSTQKTALIPV